jgi:hypothetical protein
MEIIEIQTLVDVTHTRVNRPNQGSQLEYDQNRNFITLRQCVELRSIITFIDPPVVETVDVKNLGFGKKFQGQHRIWTFRFNPDRTDVYTDDQDNPIGNLVEDLDGVPVIKNLRETINIDRATFECKDPLFKNIIIKAHQGTI